MKKNTIGTILIFATMIAGVFYLFYKKAPEVNLKTSISQTDASPETYGDRTPPDGMVEYHNLKYHFSLFYPEELDVSERLEGEGSITVIFQNIETEKGFQIFILPYSKSKVSEERFRKDIPSGVRTNLQNVTVAGATAASFTSQDLSIGDTYEVWFINKGFLYEVTTLKTLDSWLDETLKTWKFI